VVMFIYRKMADRNYQIEDIPENEKGTAKVLIAKHRNGPVGNVDLFFNANNASFRNLDKRAMEAPPQF